SPSQAKTKRAAGDACQDTWRAIGGIASAAGVADKHPERRVGHYPATASIAVVRASAPSLETAMTGRTNTGSAGSWFQNNPGFRATRKNVIIADATNTPDKSRKILSAVSSAPGYFRSRSATNASASLRSVKLQLGLEILSRSSSSPLISISRLKG